MRHRRKSRGEECEVNRAQIAKMASGAKDLNQVKAANIWEVVTAVRRDLGPMLSS